MHNLNGGRVSLSLFLFLSRIAIHILSCVSRQANLPARHTISVRCNYENPRALTPPVSHRIQFRRHVGRRRSDDRCWQCDIIGVRIKSSTQSTCFISLVYGSVGLAYQRICASTVYPDGRQFLLNNVTRDKSVTSQMWRNLYNLKLLNATAHFKLFRCINLRPK